MFNQLGLCQKVSNEKSRAVAHLLAMRFDRLHRERVHHLDGPLAGCRRSRFRVQQGYDDVKTGGVRPANPFLGEMGRKNGISR